MSLVSNFNRKPYDYRKAQEVFDALDKTPIESGSEFMESIDPIAFNDMWINPGSPEIGPSVTVKLVSPVLEVPPDKDGQCINLPQYVVASARKIIEDTGAMAQIRKGRAGFKFFEYENKWGTQIGVRFVDL